MNLSLAGLNHRTAPVELRERLVRAGHVLLDELQSLIGVSSEPGTRTGREDLREAVVMATCNRVEIYLVELSPAQAQQVVERWRRERGRKRR